MVNWGRGNDDRSGRGRGVMEKSIKGCLMFVLTRRCVTFVC